MNQSSLLTTLKAVSIEDFHSLTLGDKRYCLELITVSYTKALNFHHAVDFCQPEGFPPMPPTLQTRDLVRMACELDPQAKCILIGTLAYDISNCEAQHA